MTGKKARPAAVRPQKASPPNLKPGGGAPGQTLRPAQLPRQRSDADPRGGRDKSEGSASLKTKKKRGWPIVELAIFLLVIKIAAGAYYYISTTRAVEPTKALSVPSTVTGSTAALFSGASSGGAVARDSVGPKPEVEQAPNSRVDGYLAAAAGAVSPSVAQAAPVAMAASSDVSAVSAGAFMVLGQSASPEAAAKTAPGIPLPPGGDDLLSPSRPTPGPSSQLPAKGADVVPLPPQAVGEGSPQSLKAQQQDLARKEAMLATKEEALGALEKELNKQLAATEASRGEMEAMVRRNEAILEEMKALREKQQKEDEQQKDARIEHLVIAYKGMKPEQAGNLVNSLDDEVAVSILSAMPGRNAGQILAFVNPDKAARLTKAISERRIDPNLLLSDQPDPNL